MVGGAEIDSAGMSGRGHKSHLRGQRCIRGFVLYGARDSVRRLPGLVTARRKIDVAAQRPFAGLIFLV